MGQVTIQPYLPARLRSSTFIAAETLLTPTDTKFGFDADSAATYAHRNKEAAPIIAWRKYQRWGAS